jgi:hypothetical protein
MRNFSITNSYTRYYTELNFAREGLFELLKDKYNFKTVLYPGCSIHITPSFYFQHIAYVDISESAKDFFQDYQNLQDIINSNKKYKQLAFIEFINKDFTKELPLRECNYELLLSLYAGGISKSCKKYLKSGGIIVSNNHHNDVYEALDDTGVRLEALIYKKGGKYHLINDACEKLHKSLHDYRMPLDNMKKSGNGMEYVDKDCYFVLRKTY